MQHHAPTIYAYPSLTALLDGAAAAGVKAELPGAHGQAVTERPDSAATPKDVSQRNTDLIFEIDRSPPLAPFPEHPDGAGVALYYGDDPKRCRVQPIEGSGGFR
jgi:hypothetical protein